MKKRCCFAGHGKIQYTNDIYEKLVEIIERLIVEENIEEFWVGNYGSFDALSAKAVKYIKKKYSQIKLVLVVPYLTVEMNENNKMYSMKYDEILVADIPEKTPKRLYILKCNEYMVKRTEFLICYVMHNWGGASKTLDFAKRKNKMMIYNLSE